MKIKSGQIQAGRRLPQQARFLTRSSPSHASGATSPTATTDQTDLSEAIDSPPMQRSSAPLRRRMREVARTRVMASLATLPVSSRLEATDHMPLPNVVVVTGPHRSGTTVIGRLLLHAPGPSSCTSRSTLTGDCPGYRIATPT